MSLFSKAVRTRRKLRAAFDGPAGSGKTFSALRLAFSLVQSGMGKRVAVIDTENESSSLYAGESPDGIEWDFQSLNLKRFGPDNYTHAIETAAKEGFDVIVIDSLSHAWIGEGGALDLVDQKGGNKFTAWKDITPMQRRMVDTIIRSPAHVIATMRSKTEYIMEDEINQQGKTVKVPRKIGMAPMQREGLEFEFDVFGSCDDSHQFRVTKTRCSLLDKATTIKPGPEFWEPLLTWLQSAAPAPAKSDKTVEFEKRIRAAATTAGMLEIGVEVKDAHASGTISDANADYLRPIFNECGKRLKQAEQKSA